MKILLLVATLATVTGFASSWRFRSSTTCEHKTAKLKCPSGKYIWVFHARYGRTDYRTCPHRLHRDVRCGSTRVSLKQVRSACEGRRTCKIKASNDVFGDPCKGTYKFLFVRYLCVSNPPAARVRTACESYNLKLSCPLSFVLKIHYANYGRTEYRTCAHPHRWDISCWSKTSTKVVRSKCHNKNRCVVYASNGVFGNPCSNTYKYLSVYYGCALRRS